MEYLLIEYPKCSTCQNAKKWLQEQNIKFKERHIVENTPTEMELKEWIDRSGYHIDKFFNKSGILYRQMNLKEKLKQMKEEEKLQLLSSNGILIKRPLLIGKKQIIIGFKKEEWIEKILTK